VFLFLQFLKGYLVMASKILIHKCKSRSSAIVTAQAGMKILGDNGGRLRVVSKELCYRKVETLKDAAARQDGGGII
jgi:hypothetical protein